MEKITDAAKVAGTSAVKQSGAATTVDTTNVPMTGTEGFPDHPALDKEPRKDEPKESNQIDFNDPTLTEQEAVVKNLGGDVSKAD